MLLFLTSCLQEQGNSIFGFNGYRKKQKKLPSTLIFSDQRCLAHDVLGEG